MKVNGTVVKSGLSLKELPFITGFRDNELIDDFLVFYLRPLYLFKNSKHIFDEEHKIEELLKKTSLIESETQ